MNENVKYFGKLSFVIVFTWLKINVLNIFSTLITFFIAIGFLMENIAKITEGTSIGSGAAHAGGLEAIVGFFHVFSIRPVQSGLILFIVLLSFVMFIAGGRYIFRKIAGRIVKEKSNDLILPAMDSALAFVKGNIPSKVSSLGEAMRLKLKMIQAVKNQTQNKWVRKALVFGFKKIRLNDIDFQKEDLDIFDEIRTKMVVKMNSIETASKKYIWACVLGQWLSVLIIYLTLAILK